MVILSGRSAEPRLPLIKLAPVIFFLTIRSSYLDNTEEVASESAFDTVQLLAREEGSWRIKTYAMDQDVHVCRIGASPEELVKIAVQTQRNTTAMCSRNHLSLSRPEAEDCVLGLGSEACRQSGGLRFRLCLLGSRGL